VVCESTRGVFFYILMPNLIRIGLFFKVGLLHILPHFLLQRYVVEHRHMGVERGCTTANLSLSEGTNIVSIF